MKKIFQILLWQLLPICAMAQFAPSAGILGSTAMHSDSSAFVAWATDCEISRGWQQIDNQSIGKADYGDHLVAVGKADNNVVSLGDGGVATLTFAAPICNGSGPDFAVFENSFSDGFLELAFVEVSSDGINFFRFPAVSMTQTETQIDGFGVIDATLIHNFAGKYRVFYGTPFDLEDLEEDELLNKNAITHVRLIDVVGCIDEQFCSRDANGTIVNDPWPTPFGSSGFDLDAVGVIHDANHNAIDELSAQQIKAYPNPMKDVLQIESETEGICTLLNVLGQKMLSMPIQSGTSKLNVSQLDKGIYYLQLAYDQHIDILKLIKQ